MGAVLKIASTVMELLIALTIQMNGNVEKTLNCHQNVVSGNSKKMKSFFSLEESQTRSLALNGPQ